MNKKITILIISLMVLCTGCGSGKEHCTVPGCPYDAYDKGLCPEHYVEMAIFGYVEEDVSAYEEPAESPAMAVEEPAHPETESPAEGPDGPAPVSLDIGMSIDVGFAFMTFDDFAIREDGKTSISSGSITRSFGPDPQAGTLYACISGTLKNQDGSELPVYDFFVGTLDIASPLGGFGYGVDANDCYVFDSEGDLMSMLAPMITYNYIIVVPISAEIVDSGLNGGGFEFGFYDKFDNLDLSRNRSQERSERLCPFFYHLNLMF